MSKKKGDQFLDSDQKNLNESDNTISNHQEVVQIRRSEFKKESKITKKKIIIIVFVTLILIGSIIGIILAAKSGSSDNPEPPQPPTPPIPPTPAGFNIYQADESLTIVSKGLVEGVLKAKMAQKSALQNDENRDSSFLNPLKKDSLNQTNLQVDTEHILTGPGNEVIQEAKWSLGVAGNKAGFFKVEDLNKSRFEPAENLVKKMKSDDTMRLEMLGIGYQNSPFGFNIKSDRDGKTLLSTVSNTFYMTDKFLQIDFTLASQNLFGFGERNHEFRLSEGTWTMWASGETDDKSRQNTLPVEQYDDGTGFKQTFGVHPFLLVQSSNQNEYFGLFFRNTAAQSPTIKFNNDGTSTLSYITIGGNLEIYFFLKGTAKEIIAQYHNFIGKPALPPFWALGYHFNQENEFSYNYWQKKLSYKINGYPITSWYFDEQFFKNDTDFTIYDKDGSLNQMISSIQEDNQKMIAVLNGGLKFYETSKYISLANSYQALIQNLSNQTYVGQSQTYPIVFLDWLNSKSQEIQNKGLQDLRKVFKFDGISLDLNENTIYQEESEMLRNSSTWYTQFPQESNSTYELPFIPSKVHNFDFMSIPLNATHLSTNDTEYDIHSLNGHMQLKTTANSLKNDSLFDQKFQGLRQFVASRSTFAGSGSYGGHFFGINDNQYQTIQMMISRLFNFNLFGIPFTGSSLCSGFDNNHIDPVNELCAIQMQLSTFLPFVQFKQWQNDFSLDVSSLPKPWDLIAKNSMLDRFMYLRQIYTCLYKSKKYGGTCYEPLYFQFQNMSILESDYSIILGNATKISPQINLREDSKTFKSVFPKGKWLNLQNYGDILNITDDQQIVDLEYSSRSAIAHLREGHMIPIQKIPESNDVEDLLKMGITFVALRDKQGHAEGTVFLDDGKTIKDLEETAEEYQLLLQGKSIINLNMNSSEMIKHGTGVNEILIADAWDLSGTDFACFVSKNKREITQIDFLYSNTTQTLSLLSNDNFDLINMHTIHFGNKINDVNLCEPKTYDASKYIFEERPNLDTNNLTIKLRSIHSSVYIAKEIEMNFRQIKSGDNKFIVGVSWNYANATLSKNLFKVPETILNPNKDLFIGDLKLKDCVKIGDPDKGEDLITILDPKTKLAVYTLSGFILEQHLNIIEGKAFIDQNQRSILGLGERVSDDLYLNTGVYSMWSLDSPDATETGRLPAENCYGTHPFFMGRVNKNWYGVFVNLAAAQDWWIDNSTKPVGVKVMAAGGVGDMFFIFDETADSLISQYHSNIVGNPVLTPFWALGWHQSRWGYKTVEKLQEIVSKYQENNLPLDTIWSDIDYLDNYKDFEYDPVNFKNLPDFVQQLHNNSQHYIPIIEPGIAFRPNQSYGAFDTGIQENIFLKYAKDGDVYIGQVWPNDAVFPDFMNEKTTDYWGQMLDSLYKNIPFDGVWLDMNEVANFCDGVCYPEQRASAPVINELPYMPTGRSLERKALPLDAYHSESDDIELDTHSLFGTLETIATSEWFKKNKKRPMIIQRSAYAGLGKFGSRWLGDNQATAQYMGLSLVGVMQHNIFGIPLVGSDICGFDKNTTAELCARWHVVGSFYPFSRNHNQHDTIPQEPWEFNQIYEGSVTYLDIMRNAMKNKLSLAKYYYTQMSQLSKHGGTFIKPLFFEFPDDDKAYDYQQRNLMLGSALKLSINSDSLDQNVTDFYFPTGNWCKLFTTDNDEESCIQGGKNYNRSSKAYEFDLFLREGYMIPFIDAKFLNLNKTIELLVQPIEMHANLNCKAVEGHRQNCYAWGLVRNDDGISLDDELSPNYSEVLFYLNLENFDAGTGQFSMSLYQLNKGYDGPNNILQKMVIKNSHRTFSNGNQYDVFTFDASTGQKIDVGSAAYNLPKDSLIVDFPNIQFDITKYQKVVFQKR